jgi:hypothetical protein
MLVVHVVCVLVDEPLGSGPADPRTSAPGVPGIGGSEATAP